MTQSLTASDEEVKLVLLILTSEAQVPVPLLPMASSLARAMATGEDTLEAWFHDIDHK